MRTMIITQTLYSLILQDLLQVHLGTTSRRALSQMLSAERVHRSLRRHE